MIRVAGLSRGYQRFFVQSDFTNGTAHRMPADDPSASGSIESVTAVSHAPMKVQARPKP